VSQTIRGYNDGDGRVIAETFNNNWQLYRATLEAGAEALKATALHFHPPAASVDDAGVVLLH